MVLASRQCHANRHSAHLTHCGVCVKPVPCPAFRPVSMLGGGGYKRLGNWHRVIWLRKVLWAVIRHWLCEVLWTIGRHLTIVLWAEMLVWAISRLAIRHLDKILWPKILG